MTKRTRILNPKTLVGLLCLGALLMASSCSTDGGGAGSGEASKAVNDAHVAYSATDWMAYGSLLHPDGLNRYESILRPTIESMIPVDSTGAVAENYQWMGQTFSTQEFMNMSPAEFFSFSMTEIIKAIPQLEEAMGSAQIEILGEMMEGDSLVHVVVRTSAATMGIEMSEVSAMTTKQYDGSYRVMLSGQIEGLVTAIAQNMQQR